jgi:capsular exopolysaccharide synthesis family protein
MSEAERARALATARPDAADEQHRILAARLEPALARGARKIGVSSPSRGEGRTRTAAGAARALARAGRRRVVLVDCDLRAPSLHAALGVRAPAGLAEVLGGLAPLDGAIVRIGEDPLHLLAAGAASPSLISHPKLGELLGELARRFDAVVVDAPPVLGLADVPLLARDLDALLLVLEAGRTRRESLASALTALDDARDRLLGCVLNRTGRRSAG